MKRTAQNIILTSLLFLVPHVQPMQGDEMMMEMPDSLDMPPAMNMDMNMDVPDVDPPPMLTDDDDDEVDPTSPATIPTPTAPPLPAAIQPAATQPAPVVAAPVVAESEPEDDTPMIDTVDYPEEKIGIQGNWQRKKNWLTQALDLYQNEIEQLITKIYSVRNQFNTKYNTIDQAFDNFYKEIGIEQGQLQELFRNIERYLDKKKQKDLADLLKQKESFDLSERSYAMKSDDVETSVKDLRANLEQLKLDMKSIEDIDLSVAERLKKLDREIDIALQEGDHAREIINEMWYIIDDRKARALYYDLKGKSLEKLKAIDSYLNSDLLNDFNNVITTAQNQINKAKQEAARLEKEGLIIKKRTTRTKQLKEEKAKKEVEEKVEKEAEILKVKEPIKKKKKIVQPWYINLVNFFNYLFNQLIKSVSTILSGEPSTTKPEAPSPIQTEAT